MPSVGLSMITNDASKTIAFLEKYGEHFDTWFITVADKDTKKQYRDLSTWAVKHFDSKIATTSTDTAEVGKLKLSYFKWCDHFGKARQFNHKQINTDYFFWIDSDDEIEGIENLPDMVKLMEANDLDAIYLLYEYMQNDIGEQIAPHWRERLIKTDSALKWSNSRCHETLQAPSANTIRYEGMVIKHNKSDEEHKASLQRNIKLLKLDFEETQDPRTAMYLGDNHMHLQEFDKALEYFAHLLKFGGWAEDKYRVWINVSEIHYLRGDYERAIDACNAAEHLHPNFPNSYFQKASVYNAMDDPNKVYEWVKVGMTKTMPETLSVYDPTLEYRGMFMGALSALQLGKVDEAYELFKLVRTRSPNYKLAKEMEDIFIEAKEDQEAFTRLKWLLYYLKDRGADIGRVLGTLPVKVVADPRLNADRARLLPRKKWEPKSIAFYCGAGLENWGPDTLDRGMGGSEEAVVYLSRELAKLGWDVTVFNDREEEYFDTITDKHGSTRITPEKGAWGVTYKPWTLLNPWDEFDVFIASRMPENARGVKARKLLIDLHDTVEAERVYAMAKNQPNAIFMLKSQYHRSLYPKLDDSFFRVVTNGLVPEQFDVEVERRPISAGYFSSYDRNLDGLLDLWPEVQKRIKEKTGKLPTLDIAYGWNIYDKMHSINPERMKHKWNMIRKMSALEGVKEHGRLSHEELAKLMKSTKVWTYPTEFWEINCITALKTQVAGCIPVTTACYALEETVINHKYSVACTDFNSNPEAREKYIDNLVAALLDDEYRVETSDSWLWPNVAVEWDKAMQ